MCLGVPGKLLEIVGDDPLFRTGTVSFGGVVRAVSLAGLPGAQVGQYVIVHAGFAISTLDEDEAQEVFQYLQQMAECQEADVASRL